MPSAIETDRLIMRQIVHDDLEALASMNADPDVMRYIGDGSPQSLEQTQVRINAIINHWDEHGFGLCAVLDRTTSDFAGFCGLMHLDDTSEIEVGYRFAKRFWGMGLATEAAKASLECGFEALGIDRIVAVVHPGNLASQRVVEKLGLVYIRDARFYNSDLRYYAITRAQYKLNDPANLTAPAEG
jgi:ribosomal-protein-alanine N-acetyltransferase